MKITGFKGKIIEIYPDQHQIVVRYWSDQFPPTVNDPNDKNVRPDGSPVRCWYDRAITVRQMPMPTGDALVDLIRREGTNVLGDMEFREGLRDPLVDTTMDSAAKVFDTALDLSQPDQAYPVKTV